MKHLMRALLPLVLLATLVGIRPANAMVTYFQAAEPASFIINTSCSASARGGDYRSSYVRSFLSLGTGAGVACVSPIFAAGPQTDLWFSEWLVPEGTCTVCGLGTNQILDEFIGNDGNPAFAIRSTGSINQFKLSKATAAGVWTDLTGVCAVPYTSLNKIDLHLTYAVAGLATLYLNGAQICTFSGDTTDDVRTGIQAIGLGAIFTSNIADTDHSEIIVADSDTRSAAVYSMYPNANGTNLQWSNSSGTTPCTNIINAQNVPITNTATSYVYDAVSGQLEECAVAHTFPGAINWTPVSVAIDTVAMAQVGGPQNIDLLTRESGVEHDITGPLALPVGQYATVHTGPLATDPATGGAWSLGTLTDPAFNIGFKSAP